MVEVHHLTPPADLEITHWEPRVGAAFVHTVVDGHSRVVHAEIRDDEKAAAGVLRRAVAWFAARRVVAQ